MLFAAVAAAAANNNNNDNNNKSIVQNATHKILWDFVIQTDHLISARRLDLEIVYKKRTFRFCKEVFLRLCHCVLIIVSVTI